MYSDYIIIEMDSVVQKTKNNFIFVPRLRFGKLYFHTIYILFYQYFGTKNQLNCFVFVVFVFIYFKPKTKKKKNSSYLMNVVFCF